MTHVFSHYITHHCVCAFHSHCIFVKVNYGVTQVVISPARWLDCSPATSCTDWVERARLVKQVCWCDKAITKAVLQPPN